MHEAKTHLSRLVKAAAGGEEVIIARNGKPLVRLVPWAPAPAQRRPGTLKGKIHMGDDFDAPLPPDLAKALGVDP